MTFLERILCRLGIGGARRQRAQISASLERVAAKSDERVRVAEQKNEHEGDFLKQWLRSAQNRSSGGRCDGVA